MTAIVEDLTPVAEARDNEINELTITVDNATARWVRDGGEVLGGSFVGNETICLSMFEIWLYEVEPVKIDAHRYYVYSSLRNKLSDVAAAMIAGCPRGKLCSDGWKLIWETVNSADYENHELACSVCGTEEIRYCLTVGMGKSECPECGRVLSEYVVHNRRTINSPTMSHFTNTH